MPEILTESRTPEKISVPDSADFKKSHKIKKLRDKNPHNKTTEAAKRPVIFAVGCESVTASVLIKFKDVFSSDCQLPVQSALYARLSTLPYFYYTTFSV